MSSSGRIPPDMLAAWEAHAMGRERATFRTANLLICILVPLWSVCDFYLAPQLALRFLALRGADLAITLALAALIRRSTSVLRNRIAMAASISAVGLAIVPMLAQLGPPQYALYAFGFSLVFWGAGLLLLWPVAYGAVTFAALLVTHVVAYVLTRTVSPMMFVGSLFYLVSAALVSGAQNVLRMRLEQDAFVASFALGKRNEELARSVAALHETQARLGATSAALAESLDLATTAERVVKVAVPAFASWATLSVEGTEGKRVHAAEHVDAELREQLRAAIAEQEERAWGERTDVLLVAEAGPAEVAAAGGARVAALAPARSLLEAPLVARGRRIGTLLLGRTGGVFEASDGAFAEELARRASMALDNARLYCEARAARQQADAASDAKDEFLASVSHELRTPLSSILGWARQLRRPDLGDTKRARALETIDRNAVAMTQLIEDLLDVSRIVSGKLRLDMRAIDPAVPVEAAIESLRPTAEAKSIAIEADLAHDVGTVKGDAMRLQQVVWNLLSNALKFSPGGSRVRVALLARGQHAEIVVRDNGKGIDPQFLQHVFERFRQADASVTRHTGGLGLGLAIAKHIVELHGGSLVAHSEGLGRGATFTARLPLAAPAARIAAAPPGRNGHDAPPQLEGLRVLVVDDEEDLREFIGEVLSACGSRVTTVGSAKEALRQFDAGELPDVLLSDLGMPGESGYDLIRRVRQRPASSGGGVPAAAITAYARAEDRRKVLDAGFELHVPKPIEPAELVSVVATLARFAHEK